MRTWEIVNPSDYYTIVSERFWTAAAATMLLGNCQYGLIDLETDKLELPIMLGWNESHISAWWEEYGDPTLNIGDYLVKHAVEVANALDTVLIGDRAVARTSSMDQIEWHDHHRTSLNDIGRHAWSLAAALRGRQEEVE